MTIWWDILTVPPEYWRNNKLNLHGRSRKPMVYPLAYRDMERLRRDSNPQCSVRSRVVCPLACEDICFKVRCTKAGSAGFEPAPRESESRVLPLDEEPMNLNLYVLSYCLFSRQVLYYFNDDGKLKKRLLRLNFATISLFLWRPP